MKNPSRNIRDVDVQERIPLDYCIGPKFKYEGCMFEIVKREGNLVQLDISSWVGISIGAQHTYGKLKLPYIYAKCIKASKKQPYYKEGTTISGTITNDYEGIRSIDITRPVTQKDKRMEGGETFRAWRVGDATDRFDTEAELIDKAKREFLRIFEPGWSLYIERDRKVPNKDYWENYNDIICTS